jgi:hypothetical protein
VLLLDERWIYPNVEGPVFPIILLGEALVGVIRPKPFFISGLRDTRGEFEDVIRIRSGAKTALAEVQILKIRCLGPTAFQRSNMLAIRTVVGKGKFRVKFQCAMEGKRAKLWYEW